MATKKTNTKTAQRNPKAVAKAKRAPGNAKALQDKAADNVAKLRKQSGHAESIAKVLTVRSGSGVLLETSRGRNIHVAREDGRTRKLAVVGLPVQPLEDYLKTQPKPQAQMARGTDAHVAPHSAKAVADQKRTAKAAPVSKGKVRTEKASKAKQPSRGANRTYKLAGRKDESKAGTFRTYMLSTIMAHKDTDSAKAAHAKSRKYTNHKLDFNWAAQQGYITFTN